MRNPYSHMNEKLHHKQSDLLNYSHLTLAGWLLLISVSDENSQRIHVYVIYTHIWGLYVVVCLSFYFPSVNLPLAVGWMMWILKVSRMADGNSNSNFYSVVYISK